MPHVAIAVMARSPAAARASVKTRLIPIVPDESDRIELYRAFLTDTLSVCRSVPDLSLRVAYTPEGGPGGFESLGVAGHELLPQRGGDLAARERHLFEDLFREGFDAAIIVGSDLPTLPPGHVEMAIDALSGRVRRVVLARSADGGYYLMGLQRPPAGGLVPDLFTSVRMSTRSAFDDTMAAARRAGLDVALVPGWYDIDDEAGLERLRSDLDRTELKGRAVQTRRVMQRLFGD